MEFLRNVVARNIEKDIQKEQERKTVGYLFVPGCDN